MKKPSSIRWDLKVLETLDVSLRLTQSQLTMGPLRHASQTNRLAVLRSLMRSKFIEKTSLKSARGPAAACFFMTEKGRIFLIESRSKKT